MNYIEELKKKPIQIENFLSEDTANNIYPIIDSQAHWITNSKHKKSYEYEKSKFKEGQFSYWYSSIENKEFIQNLFFLLNLELKISKLLENKFFTAQSIFVSKYTCGHFLSPHNDNALGRKYAFVYNLTKDAAEKKGGCLNFINDKNNITYKLLPKFNSLNIFDVENIKDLHYVDEIIDKNYKRYSISGWIYETNLKTKNTISLL
jgi:Rps23 Pro-64 3,4-dihydroxylase Tpa1-like proline 4-hydroxylase